MTRMVNYKKGNSHKTQKNDQSWHEKDAIARLGREYQLPDS